MNAATKLPTQLGAIHFIGIGGIGMSGIAEVLINHGYTIQGSDLKASKITERLAEMGATVFVGQKAGNIEGAEVVVISSAIKPGNLELDAARAYVEECMSQTPDWANGLPITCESGTGKSYGECE